MKIPGFVLVMGLLAAGSARAASPAEFPFHNGDRVVFLGDSITEQKLYTTYVETYLLTRFPSWKLTFRNAGWGGDTSYLRTRGVPPAQALQRDVLDLHPTVVTIDFSMNDAGYTGATLNQDLYNRHYQGEQNIVRQLKAAHALPVVLTVSPVEKNEPGDDMLGYNETLEKFAAGDQQIAAQERVPFADQFHPFVSAINRLRMQAGEKARLSGDAVHPGNAGHLMMADFILTGLNAPPVVSAATIDAGNGRVSGLTRAHVSDVVRENGGVTFTRADDALVFPIENAARTVLQIVPVVDDLDRYMLQVKGLKPGSYLVTVDDKPVARFSQAELGEGVNLAFYDSPLTSQGMEILGHVYAKNNAYFDLWRNVELHNEADKDTRTADLTARIADEEKTINALRSPRTYQFSVMPAPEEKAPAVTP